MQSCNLWVEKYRPRSFDDIIDQEKPIERLKSFLETGTMPHLILTGQPGTGKSSSAHILVKSMFPPEILEDRVLELNASEERGIRTVRGKIKRFVSSSVQDIAGVLSLSIVILDEADALTLDSQYALRRIMEDSAKNSRFILICNYVNRIISPLISRCSIIYFNALRPESIKMIINRICSEEDVSSTYRNRVLENNTHDARTAINHLQRLVTGNKTSEEIDINWTTLLGLDPSELIEEIEDLLLDGNDIDTLLENFIKWTMETDQRANSQFLERSLQACCNVANHGTPIIQLTSLILGYASVCDE